MHSKSIVTIVVLSLVVASLFVGGCTTTTTSPTPKPSGNNAILEKTVSYRKDQTDNETQTVLYAWNVIWHGDNSVTILDTRANKHNPNDHVSQNETLIAFPTTQDATNYLNALDKSNYRLLSSTYNRTQDFYPVFMDHDPQTYQHWLYPYTEGNSEWSLVKDVSIYQKDNIIQIYKYWPTHMTSEPTV